MRGRFVLFASIALLTPPLVSRLGCGHRVETVVTFVVPSSECPLAHGSRVAEPTEFRHDRSWASCVPSAGHTSHHTLESAAASPESPVDRSGNITPRTLGICQSPDCSRSAHTSGIARLRVKDGHCVPCGSSFAFDTDRQAGGWIGSFHHLSYIRRTGTEVLRWTLEGQVVMDGSNESGC